MTKLTININIDEDIDATGKTIIEDLILDMLLKYYKVLSVKSQ